MSDRVFWFCNLRCNRGAVRVLRVVLRVPRFSLLVGLGRGRLGLWLRRRQLGFGLGRRQLRRGLRRGLRLWRGLGLGLWLGHGHRLGLALL